MPSRGELLHHVEHVADRLRVERARRLVEEHQRRVHRERARDRDALLLSARELAGVRVALVGEPDPVEQALGVGDRLVLRDAADAHRRLDDVVEHRHVRPEVEALEDEADLDAVPGDVALGVGAQTVLAVRAVADQVAVDLDAAAVDRLEVVDAAQERRLARAGRADQAHDLAAPTRRG